MEIKNIDLKPQNSSAKEIKSADISRIVNGLLEMRI